MKRDGHENTAFFIGPEVEHTPAFSRKTLFVVGKQDLDKILDLAREHKVTHIFMGANHSFDIDPTDGTLYWDQTITALLDRGFWVSLDYPAHQHEKVLMILNKGIWQSRIFVPLLSVRIPHVQASSVNLTVKIDDIDFKATNAGVWCLHHHEVTDSNRFTDWLEYNSDVVIGGESNPAVTPVVKTPVTTTVESAPVDENAKNDGSLGLDANAPSSLKPDTEEVLSAMDIKTPIDAAEAYAAGAKEDPLGKESSKKPKAKK
jgi:hypothetical protein